MWDAVFDVSFRDCPAKGGTGGHPSLPMVRATGVRFPVRFFNPHVCNGFGGRKISFIFFSICIYLFIFFLPFTFENESRAVGLLTQTIENTTFYNSKALHIVKIVSNRSD
jgi:hypothetical protein